MTAPTGRPVLPAAPPAPDDARAVVDLHAESLSARTVQRPYRRVVVRREIVTEEVSVVVTVRREVLRVEHEDLVDDAPGPFVVRTSDELPLTGATTDPGIRDSGTASDPGRAALEIVLHEERPVVGVEVVPVERVTVRAVRREALGVVRAEVRREEVELDGSAAARPSPPAAAR